MGSPYGLGPGLNPREKGEGQLNTRLLLPVLPDMPSEQTAHPATFQAAPVAMFSNSLDYILTDDLNSSPNTFIASALPESFPQAYLIMVI